MPFNRPTLNELIVRIQNDITSRLTGLIPLLSRSLLKILARVFAGAFDSVYGNQEFISNQITIGTASEEWLRRYAFQWDVTIQEATYSSGFYEFTGSNGSVIPINTILVRTDNIEFITKTLGTISGGSADVEIEARTPGAIGNTVLSTPMVLVSPIVGVNTEGTVTGDGLEGGIDSDTVEEIRSNILNRIKLPPMGGSYNDYVNIAEAVPGVDRAFPFPNQAGLIPIPGSVTVVIAGIDPLTPSPTLLNNVLLALDDPDFAPIVVQHFTEAIVPQWVDMTIYITPNNQAIQDNIRTNLEAVFEADATPGGTILISHIRNAISTSGVEDYLINSITTQLQGLVPVDQDIDFIDFEYPYIDNIGFSDL